jgi:hypothetical protein
MDKGFSAKNAEVVRILCEAHKRALKSRFGGKQLLINPVKPFLEIS